MPKFVIKKPDEPSTPRPVLSQIPKFITPSQTDVNFSDSSIIQSSAKVFRALNSGSKSPLQRRNHVNDDIDEDILDWNPPIERSRPSKVSGGFTEITQNLVYEEEQKVQLECNWKTGPVMKVLECKKVNQQVMDVLLEREERGERAVEKGKDLENDENDKNEAANSIRDLDVFQENENENQKTEITSQRLQTLLLFIDDSIKIKIGDKIKLGKPLTENPIISYLDWGKV